MPKVADLGGKRLISLAPDNWVQWVTQQPNLQVKEIVSSNFQWIGRENDVLIKVCDPEQGDFLVLNELQLRYSSKMPQRIRAYAALAEERYNLKVYPVLINIIPVSSSQIIPNTYESNLLGLVARQDYRVINLWEVDVNLVFEQNLSSLLPFVPILKGGGNEEIIRQALITLQSNENLAELEPLLSFFASFVLDIPLIQQIMRWDMTVLRESPWYNTILQEGLQQGEATLILRLLDKRFGQVDESLKLQIQQLTSNQLEQLAESLLDFTSIEDLEAWLFNVM